jgi:hypothetical protein
MWNMTFGGELSDSGYWVKETSDGGYIIAAETESFGAGENDAWLIKIKGRAPTAPEIKGPAEVLVGIDYLFTFKSTDPDGDDVFYYIDWGDGSVIEWDGPYPSGQEIIISHNWSEKGTFNVKARANDTNGYYSDWATLPVVSPKVKLIHILFYRFIERFPLVYRILSFL